MKIQDPEVFREQYNKHLAQALPSLSLKVTGNILSPFILNLPTKVLQEASHTIDKIWQTRTSKDFQESIAKTYPLTTRASNYAALMSYDFHWNDTELGLVEINTNASGAMLLHHLYLVQGEKSPVLDELKTTFTQEAQFFSGKISKVAIVDEAPTQQKMYLEFLLYKELFQSMGWSCDILDSSSQNILDYQFIYNRSTDFYLEKHPYLLNGYIENKFLLTPHPWEYHLLANKERLTQLQPENVLEVKKQDPDELWMQRKKYFFKPKTSYAGKQVYRGASISHKVFDQILKGDFIAQKYYAPGRVKLQWNEEVKEFKYDLRFFAYKNKIQFVLARLYQGQVTNFKEKGSGFALVHFS